MQIIVFIQNEIELGTVIWNFEIPNGVKNRDKIANIERSEVENGTRNFFTEGGQSPSFRTYSVPSPSLAVLDKKVYIGMPPT